MRSTPPRRRRPEGKFHGNAEEREGKLHFKGAVTSEDDKNAIWNAIKTIPDWQKEVVTHIEMTGGGAAAKPAAAPARPVPAAARTYPD